MIVEVLLNSADDLSNQVAGSPLDLEHALIMLLLLVGLLTIRGKYLRYVPWVIVGGVALSLFTPTHVYKLAWPILSALVLPPMLWQVALRLATIRPAFSWRSLLAWLLTIILIGLALSLGAKVSVAIALLMGILAASLMWQLRERTTGRSDLGSFGQLTLALLLVEVDATLLPLKPLLRSLFSGAALGLFLGYVGVRLAPRFPLGKARNLFYLGLIYLAYFTGAMIGTSGITMAIMTGLVVASYSYSVGLWPTKEEWQAPLNQGWFFVLLAGTWLLLGWQAHVPLMPVHITGIGLALVAAAASVLVGRRLAPMPEARPLLQLLLYEEGKVFLLLLGVFLLWPLETVLPILHLAMALVAALVIIFILRILIYQIFYLEKIEMLRPGE
ncbi:hypothetical protein ACFLZW_04785 [Chloroflexota bacterium]